MLEFLDAFSEPDVEAGLVFEDPAEDAAAIGETMKDMKVEKEQAVYDIQETLADIVGDSMPDFESRARRGSRAKACTGR